MQNCLNRASSSANKPIIQPNGLPLCGCSKKGECNNGWLNRDDVNGVDGKEERWLMSQYLAWKMCGQINYAFS